MVVSAATLAAASGLQPGLDMQNLAGLLPLRPIESHEPPEAAVAEALALQRAQWLERQSALEGRIADLTARLHAVEQERTALLAAADSASARDAVLRTGMETELEALKNERQALAARRLEFEAQTERLGQELDALVAQRNELEKQRQALEAQRLEFESLLNRLDEAAARGDGATVPGVGVGTGAAVQPVGPDDDAGQLLASAEAGSVPGPLPGIDPVGNERLGEMRGAFRVPGGYDMSLGITQSASVNGIEQISNTLSLGGPAGQLAEALLIQVGESNITGAGLLDAVSNGMGTVIQNAADAQLIQTKTIIDLSLQDVSGVVDSLAIHQALDQSLSLQR